MFTYGLDRLGTIDRGTSLDFVRRTPSYEAMGRLSAYSDEHRWTTRQMVCENQFDLDSCQEVTTEHVEPLRAESFSYDAVGNRTDRGAVSAPRGQEGQIHGSAPALGYGPLPPPRTTRRSSRSTTCSARPSNALCPGA